VGFPFVYAVSEITRGVDFEMFRTEADVPAGVSWAVIWGVSYVSLSAAPQEGVAAERYPKRLWRVSDKLYSLTLSGRSVS
jgi:hypothetical protein